MINCIVFWNSGTTEHSPKYFWDDNEDIQYQHFIRKSNQTEIDFYKNINELEYSSINDKIIICDLKTYRETKIQSINKYIILSSVQDSGDIMNFYFINQEQIQYLIQPLINKYVNFKEICVSNGRYHYSFYSENKSIKFYKHKLNISDLNTQKLIPIFFEPTRAVDSYSNDIDVNLSKTNRDIDIMALWGDSVSGDLPDSSYTYHRKHLKKLVIQLKNEYPALNILYEGKLPQNVFLSKLKSTKLMIGPYGIGAHTIRDWQAFNAGALLVKPDTDFLDTHQDMFVSGETYVKFKPDLSDFKEIILECLHNYDKYQHIIHTAKQKMQKNTIKENQNTLKSLLLKYNFNTLNNSLVNITTYDELYLIDKAKLYYQDNIQFLEYKLKDKCDPKLLNLYNISTPKGYLYSTGIHLMFSNFLWDKRKYNKFTIIFEAKAMNQLTLNQIIKIYDGESHKNISNIPLSMEYKKYSFNIDIINANTFLVKNRISLIGNNILGMNVLFKNIRLIY